MADNTIDTLSLQISSDAGKAVDSLDRLAESLTKIKNSLGGGWIANMKDLSTNIHSLSGATKKLDTGRLTGFASALGKLSGSVTALAAVSGDLTPAINNLGKLAAFDFSKLKVSGNYDGFGTLVQGMGKLADIAPKVAALKASEINRTLKSFEKIGNVDFSSTVQSLQTLNGLDVTGFTALSGALLQFSESAQKLAAIGKKDMTTALKNIERLGTINFSALSQGIASLNGLDLSQLAALGQAFQSFTSSLAGSERIAAGTQRIITALSNLAVSANNIPTVTANLPGLTVSLLDLLNVISTAPAVEAGTVSLVSTLAMLANAGTKASKVAAALPELAAGVRGFVQMLHSLPRLDKNILRAVEALAKLANAGGRAGSASRDLLVNINRLSGSMGNLRSGAFGAAGGLRSFAGQLLAALGITGGLYGAVRAAKASISTYSDLIEVGNVVQKSFGQTANKMEDLAKISISDFGMSELTAKQIASRYQAMGVAMGFTQDKMSDMSLELTKLAADMASFYNVEQKDVAESLESIFTGTTRPLRTYGLDLTQATLQEWALKQGIDADIQSMSQMEKTMLRYQYVLANTENIAGDFRDTQGSWANQTRILIEQFKQLGSVIGGGLVAALFPAVKALNVFLAKIIQVARAISSFLGGLLGIKGTVVGAGAGLAQTSDYADDLADSTESAAGGIADTGSAAKKAKKDLGSFAASWHEVTNMSSSDSGDVGGSGGVGGVSMPDMSLPSEYEMEITADDKVSPILEAIRKRFKELADLFMAGFRIGLGDTSVFDSIRMNLESIQTSLIDIFTDKKVINAFNRMLDTLAFDLGRVTGSFVSIGATIADNLTAGIARYLEFAKERIKGYLISMFNITGDISTIAADFAVAAADIFSVFRSDSAKQITADIIQIFADCFMGVTELAVKLGRDILGLILNPITENAGGFKEALQNTLSPLAEIMTTISDSFTNLWNTVRQTYDEHISPMFQSFTEGMSEIVGSLLDGYNTHIAPILDNLAGKFTEVWEGTISPLLENFIGLFGDVSDFVTVIWQNVFQPVVNWIATAIMPVVAPVLQSLGDAFLITFEAIGKLFDGFITAARGVLQFLTGVFSGDWEKAWTGVKTVFKGIWDMFPGFVKEPIRAIIGSVNKMIDAIQGGMNRIIQALNKFSVNVPDWVPEIGGKTFGFNLSEISLPHIPQLARGGVINGPTLAMIGEAGREAVLPLENNTGWISSLSERISDNLKRDFGDLQLDYSVPEVEKYSPRYFESDLNQLKYNMQMAMDESTAQQAYELRQERDFLIEQNELLRAILNKPIIQDRDVFNANRRETLKFGKRTRKDPFPIYGRA